MSTQESLMPDTERLSKAALRVLFLEARSQNLFLDRVVPNELLRQVYELARMGPTSANCSPLRVVFLTTDSAKSRLIPLMSAGNVEKTRSAPVVALLGYDLMFHTRAAQLFPHRPETMEAMASNEDRAKITAFRNGTLQAAYFMLAARALGLDCGPMSGFDESKVNATFFPQGSVRINFICNLGYGDADKLFPRLPRPSFDDVCRIL